jgi:hypothetical protein
LSTYLTSYLFNATPLPKPKPKFWPKTKPKFRPKFKKRMLKIPEPFIIKKKNFT